MSDRLCPHCESAVAQLSEDEDAQGNQFTYCPYCSEEVTWDELEIPEDDW